MAESLSLHKVADREGTPEVVTDDDGNTKEVWPLKGVKLFGAAPKDHHFSLAFMLKASGEGWATFDGRKFTINTMNAGDLVYEVTPMEDRSDAMVATLREAD